MNLRIKQIQQKEGVFLFRVTMELQFIFYMDF